MQVKLEMTEKELSALKKKQRLLPQKEFSEAHAIQGLELPGVQMYSIITEATILTGVNLPESLFKEGNSPMNRTQVVR